MAFGQVERGAAFEAGRDRLRLPPGFARAVPPAGEDAFAYARRAGRELGAGALLWSAGPDQLDLAVVLEPDEPLATARRAFLVGMAALLDAVASVAPPDKPLQLLWPDTVRFDGARLGGGRLAWPDGAREDETPDFLAFGASLIVSKARSGDPGLTPGSTSFEEEGFEPGADAAVVEAFPRHLLRGFDAWREVSFEAAVAAFLARLSGPEAGRRPTLDGFGNLLRGDGSGGRLELAPALRAPAWLDERTGTVRL